MKKLSFKKIDAFATAKSTGNPAGFIRLNSLNEIKEETRQQIARELKGFVSEVGYAAQVGPNEIDLCYFSAEREVEFCGHATIAILYDLVCTREEFGQMPELIINTKRGSLHVENRLKTEDSVFIMSPEPIYYEQVPASDKIATNLGIDASKIANHYPITIINAGLSTLLVPIEDLETMLSINPELTSLKEFCVKSDIDIIEVFTPDVSGSQSHYRTRVFAPRFGYLEDPATGSGNSAFGYYLLKYNLWPAETIVIEQNGEKENFNIVKLQKKTDSNGTVRVWFGGKAITRIEGTYCVHND